MTAVAPEVQRKFDKVKDLKHPTMENVKEFWNHDNDPSFSDEIVISKISIVVLMLQQKPPNIGGHQFTREECKEWYVNPFITKAVLSHLVSIKKGEDDTDIMLKQMSLVTVTFDPTSENRSC